MSGGWAGSQAAANKETADCEDFGELFLSAANASPDENATVINVREAWSSHHCMPDRDAAPAPVLLPFLVETDSFRAAMFWKSIARTSLGLKSVAEHLVEGTSGPGMPQEGTLPESFRTELEAIFGCKFEDFGVIVHLAFSSIPEFAKEA